MALWLGAVMVGNRNCGTARRVCRASSRSPTSSASPKIRPNPLYRRVCYTFAWSEAVTFAVLNIAGLIVAIVTGQWYLKQIYRYGYFPLAGRSGCSGRSAGFRA